MSVTTIADIFDEEVDWVSAVSAAQLESVIAARALNNDVEALDFLFDTCPELIPNDGAGSQREAGRDGEPSYRDRVLDEIHDLLCRRDRYTGAKADLRKRAGTGQVSLVAVITSAISPYLGQAAPLLVAPVVIVLGMVGSVGLNAWCKQQTDRRRSGR